MIILKVDPTALMPKKTRHYFNLWMSMNWNLKRINARGHGRTYENSENL